jgi:hypothetical protein
VVDLGEVEIMENLTTEKREQLKFALLNSGLELMDDKRAILIEKIINVITEMIHYSDDRPKMNYSDYISEKLNYDYTYLANLFSEIKGITIFNEGVKRYHPPVKNATTHRRKTLPPLSF